MAALNTKQVFIPGANSAILRWSQGELNLKSGKKESPIVNELLEDPLILELLDKLLDRLMDGSKNGINLDKMLSSRTPPPLR